MVENDPELTPQERLVVTLTQIKAALVVLPVMILNNGMNCTRMILKDKNAFILFIQNRPRQNSNSAARNWINSSPQTEMTTFVLSSVLTL